MPTGFHVRHDLQPELTKELLLILHSLPSEQSTDQLKTAAQIRGYKLSERKDYGKLFRSLAELGLLISANNEASLSDRGKIVATMAAIYPHLLPDFVHFIYCTSWDIDPAQRFSWSYKMVCDMLWKNAPITIDRADLVSQVLQEALEQFNLNGISFSTSSLAGVLNWVTALEPICVTGEGKRQIFNRRSHCSIELFALALNHIYQINRNETAFVSLLPPLREQICSLCLITLEAFDEMLDQTEEFFPKLQIRRERGERITMNDFSWADIIEQELSL